MNFEEKLYLLKYAETMGTGGKPSASRNAPKPAAAAQPANTSAAVVKQPKAPAAQKAPAASKSSPAPAANASTAPQPVSAPSMASFSNGEVSLQSKPTGAPSTPPSTLKAAPGMMGQAWNNAKTYGGKALNAISSGAMRAGDAAVNNPGAVLDVAAKGMSFIPNPVAQLAGKAIQVGRGVQKGSTALGTASVGFGNLDFGKSNGPGGLDRPEER